MTFSILARDQQGEIQKYTLLAGSLEIGFWILDEMAARGNSLVNVTIEDGTSLVHLPVEAFNEYRCLPVIERLEKEWQRILSTPLPATTLPTHSLPQGSYVARRVLRHQKCIATLIRLIGQAEQRIQRVRGYSLNEPGRNRTLFQLTATLHRLQENLAAEQSSLQRFQAVCNGF